MPSVTAQEQAAQSIRVALPKLATLELEQSESVVFYDCGANFENVFCPHCRSSISMDWWVGTMDADFVDEGFRLAHYALPCCGRESNLNDLQYDWPQAFGRFAITVMNPDVAEVPRALLSTIESQLACTITVIRQHI